MRPIKMNLLDCAIVVEGARVEQLCWPHHLQEDVTANKGLSVLQPLLRGVRRHHLKTSSARSLRTHQAQRMQILTIWLLLCHY
ncbi:hypothetical protein PVAP13_5KG387400 [Panicum virgatum]|uniref:Uncharacterized protein n=1 Tax=Panicum virgatum TaxID=38727 RepID=A0A8T0SS11_PANVG|nr:hypothetical protein PVAP13_5KG387400 [Panicum virgatum]